MIHSQNLHRESPRSREAIPKKSSPDLNPIFGKFLIEPRTQKTFPKQKKRRFLRARVNSTKLTLRIASTQVMTRINVKRMTQIGLESTKQKIPKNSTEKQKKEKLIIGGEK